ncbi:hypothetical protein ACFQQB_58540 [Nonomuraea rubra]|uniref:hypothetical protein n=1 Tax=Nonomuraea rubra TaxID=46180 RepID=UPI00360C743D
MLQIGPGPPVERRAQHHGEPAQGAGREQLAQLGQREDPILAFLDHAHAGQRAQQPVQRAGVRADRDGELRHRPGAAGQLVGHGQGGGGADGLGDPRTGDEPGGPGDELWTHLPAPSSRCPSPLSRRPPGPSLPVRVR